MARRDLSYLVSLQSRARRALCNRCLGVLQKPVNQISVKNNTRAGDKQKNMCHCALIWELVIHGTRVAHGRQALIQVPAAEESRCPLGLSSVLPSSYLCFSGTF